jgi:hypothetical protein
MDEYAEFDTDEAAFDAMMREACPAVLCDTRPDQDTPRSSSQVTP